MTSTPTESGSPAKVSTLTLSTFVVGSMVGAGVFSLPGQFAGSAGVAGALLAWALAGTGTLMLALVFQRLAVQAPHLDAGVFAYAKAGFGDYLGFISAFGYWASAVAGNVFYWVFVTTTLGAVFPALGEGDTPAAIGVASVGLWLFYALIRRGVTQAAALNRVVTIAKVAPIVLFVVLCLFVFDPAVFAANWTGGIDAPPLWDQVTSTLLVTVFVFIGIEGASVYSRHARRRRDVGRATLLGFLSVLAVFASVTMVSYGVLPREDLAALRQPSMAAILEEAVGPWGAAFVGVALIVAVLGAYLAWTLMAAEVLLVAARAGVLPRPLRRADAKDVPVGALTITTALAQLMLIVVLFSDNAFDIALDLTSALILIPYLLSAAFGLKLALTTPGPLRVGATVVAACATAYTAFLLLAAGATYVLLSLIVLVPATALFAAAKRERGERVFTPAEWVVFAVAVAGAVAAAALLATGSIGL